MIGAIKKNGLAFLVVAAFFSFLSCAHTESPSTLGPGTEVWEFDLKGETQGKLRMLLVRTEIEKGVYSIHGEFSGMAHDHLGGTGMLKCKFEGRITGNNLKADFTGRGDMANSVYLKGILSGTLSDSEGRGEYHVSHEEGRSAGKWNMKR